MKKLLLVLMLCSASLFTVQAQSFEDINWGEKFALYLPNRILDALKEMEFQPAPISQ